MTWVKMCSEEGQRGKTTGGYTDTTWAMEVPLGVILRVSTKNFDSRGKVVSCAESLQLLERVAIDLSGDEPRLKRGRYGK